MLPEQGRRMTNLLRFGRRFGYYNYYSNCLSNHPENPTANPVYSNARPEKNLSRRIQYTIVEE